MDEKQTFLFDLQGYVTVPDALNRDELERLNSLLDRHIAKDCDADMETHRFGVNSLGELLEWDEIYRELIDNPRIVSYLTELLGNRFRLDHLFLDIIRAGKGPIGTHLHGASGYFDPSMYFHFAKGKMYNGMLVVAYNLNDVNPGDGGFGCVPGSHKSNYHLPKDWRDTGGGCAPCVQEVDCPAGTAVIFTEALIHSALPWRGAGERRTLFYKYTPHPVAYAYAYLDAGRFADLSQRQREILEPPNGRYLREQ